MKGIGRIIVLGLVVFQVSAEAGGRERCALLLKKAASLMLEASPLKTEAGQIAKTIAKDTAVFGLKGIGFGFYAAHFPWIFPAFAMSDTTKLKRDLGAFLIYGALIAGHFMGRDRLQDGVGGINVSPTQNWEATFLEHQKAGSSWKYLTEWQKPLSFQFDMETAHPLALFPVEAMIFDEHFRLLPPKVVRIPTPHSGLDTLDKLYSAFSFNFSDRRLGVLGERLEIRPELALHILTNLDSATTREAIQRFSPSEREKTRVALDEKILQEKDLTVLKSLQELRSVLVETTGPSSEGALLKELKSALTDTGNWPDEVRDRLGKKLKVAPMDQGRLVSAKMEHSPSAWADILALKLREKDLEAVEAICRAFSTRMGDDFYLQLEASDLTAARASTPKKIMLRLGKNRSEFVSTLETLRAMRDPAIPATGLHLYRLMDAQKLSLGDKPNWRNWGGWGYGYWNRQTTWASQNKGEEEPVWLENRFFRRALGVYSLEKIKNPPSIVPLDWRDNYYGYGL